MQTTSLTLDLRRRPHRERSPLQAWDSADVLALEHIAELDLPTDARYLVVNDSFGALACGLAGTPTNASPVTATPVTAMTDSVTSQLATEDNLGRNGLDAGSVKWWTPTDGGLFDVVVIKIPKSLALLEYQLRLIRHLVTPETVIVGGAKVNQIHTSTLKLFEDILGPTTTSLATRKSRLIFSTASGGPDGGGGEAAQQKSPDSLTSRYRVDQFGVTAVGRPGVFSANKLDPGSRLMLEALPKTLKGLNPASILDLGCGNGVLAAAAASLLPEATITLLDESHLAVESARLTMGESHPDRAFDFLVADRVPHDAGPFDLVLNNPPFHQAQAIDDTAARLMFADAHDHLSPGGSLLVVANRHLGHHVTLKRQFGNVDNVASNRKFVVLLATRLSA